MIDPFKKARDGDREAAVDVVRAAQAAGQVSQPDAELRVQRLEQARTMAEIQAITRDLQVPQAVAAPARPTDLVGSARVATPTAYAVARPEERRSPVVGTVAAVVILVCLVGVGLAGMLFVGGVTGQVATGESERRTGHRVVTSADFTSARGYDGFVVALRAKTGSSVVFSATVYPRYVLVEVPVGARGDRSVGWYYDGAWKRWTGRGTSDGRRFELADLDGATVAGTLRKARRMVKEPSTSYVLVNAAGREDGVCLSAYATNRRDETAYVDATCDGEVVVRTGP